MRIFVSLVACVVLVFLTLGCSGKTPKTFDPLEKRGWKAIEIREGVDCERAWKSLVVVLAREFDVAFAMRDEGYIRTDWCYTWSGTYRPNYRARIICKLDDDCQRLEVKTEAEFFNGKKWIRGSDNAVFSTFRTDIMGLVGRTTQ